MKFRYICNKCGKTSKIFTHGGTGFPQYCNCGGNYEYTEIGNNEKQRDLQRLENYLRDFPDLDIHIISKNNIIAKGYWDRIKEYIPIEKKPIIITENNYYKDGYSAFNAIIILCGHWYENPIVFSEIFRMHLKEAKFTLPIGEFPEPKILNGLHSEISIINEMHNCDGDRTNTIKQLRMIADDIEKGCGGFNYIIGVDLASSYYIEIINNSKVNKNAIQLARKS